MGKKKVVLPLVAIAVVLSIIAAGEMFAGGLSQASDVQPVERVESVEEPAYAANEEGADGQMVSRAEKSQTSRTEEKTISEVLRAHVLPGVARVYHVVRYDEEALKEDILSTFPDVEDVRVDEDIVYIKYKDGTVDIYETGFEDQPKQYEEES